MSTPWDNLDNQALAQLMEAYLLGSLTDEQIDLFEASLLSSPDAASDCAEAIETVAMTREVFRDHQEQRAILDRDETLQGFHRLLAELGEAEDHAEAQLVHLAGQAKAGTPLWQQWQFVIPSAIAALLAIAVILIVTVPTGSPSSITDNTPIEPGDVGPAPPDITPQTVATLTASHNATWAEGALAPGSLTAGSKLHPNTRLTLTAGFAEVTTTSGAVMLLEGPCTLDLETSNSVSLSRGRLVATCQTPDSKGFTVDTPSARIVDLGTTFGVQTLGSGETYAQVFDGSITMASTANSVGSVTPMRLDKGHAAHLIPGSRMVEAVPFEPMRFVGIEALDALVGLQGEAARLSAVRWLQERSALSYTQEPYATGDAVIAIQAEDFLSIDLPKGMRNPWEIRQLADSVDEGEAGQATVLYVHEKAHRKSGQASYNIRFRQPGVYHFYLRASFSPVGKDASYGDAIYRSAPGDGTPFMDAEEGLAEEERLRETHWLESDAMPVGRFAWWDCADQSNPQTLHLSGIKEPVGTVPRRYVVTEADLVKTHQFVLAAGEPGVAIDGFVFAQRDDLTAQELDLYLKSAQKPKQP